MVLKGYTFNVGESKTQYITIKTTKKRVEEANIHLTKGKVTRTNEYKFLGNWINQEGNVERRLDEIQSKINGMIVEMKRLTKDKEIGTCTSDARILLYQKTVVPSITYYLENVDKISKD